MVRQTKGFGWGAAGVSTALFTGPLLSEVMEFVKPLETAGYLWMEGADELVCPRSSKIPILSHK